MIPLLLSLLLMLASAGDASSHELRPAYLQIRETGLDEFSVTWKVPAIGDMRLGLNVQLPDSCTSQDEAIKSIENNAYFERWSVKCAGGLAGKAIRIDGLKATLTDALVRISYLNGTAETVRVVPRAPQFTVAGYQTPRGIAATYLWLGVEHILMGFDHLVFILVLLILGPRLRTVLKTVTAFTVAHSITLSGAILGYLSVPQKPVEFLIAFSIAIAAAEIAKSRNGTQRLSERSPWLIAFPFGLLHGFGFAGALEEIGLPQTDIPLALLSFNVGVEFGQLFFVAAVLSVWTLASAVIPVPTPQARLIAAYCIGCIAATWMLSRANALF